MRDNIFENNSVGRTFFKFALPSVVGLLIVSMQTMIDGIFIGRYVGSRGLAAINISMPYINTVMSVGMMVSLGGGVIASIYLGRSMKKRAGEIAFFTLMTKVLIIGGISLLSMLFLDKIVYFLGADRELFPLVKGYLLPMASMAIFYNLIVYTETFARIGGRPNAVFLSGFTAFTANVILDYIFVGRMGFGMTGAATASIMANFIGALALSPLFFRNRSNIQVSKPIGDRKLLKDILYNGSSEMLTVVSAAVATFLFNRIIMQYLGEMGVSALTIIFYVNGIVNISLFGLSQALQPIVAYNLGARKAERIYRVMNISFISGGTIGIVAFIGMKFYSLEIIKLFTKGDIELTALASEAAGYFIFAYILSFINIIASSFHTAIEKPMESAVIALMRSLVFVVIFLMVLPSIIGEKGIWMAVPLAELCSVFISIALMRRSYSKIRSSLAVA